ncbi:MAG: prepilin-type N-terminal cleavage/methylation domain-containing protein, partial [Candidatus Aegiribacteria sp.]|nr:prepilin-type N-terminal cleavage/methylation domain-containing protein [Candidatus Aegiribacteria sp.]MBD3295373.1 prepilin-type N-terminal cleavage/methylation domain-containing protein [Candidatus Fermentibacteria bacterium]
MKMNTQSRSRRGMSLVEIMIVVVVLGVILGAVVLLLTKGTEEFHFSRRQNELDIAGREALDTMTQSIIWAGYMPQGGWSDEDWHPVVTAEDTLFQFYADWPDYKLLTPSDYRRLRLNNEGRIEIQNGDGDVITEAGHHITSLDFNYLDAGGNDLATPLDSVTRDQVRHIQIQIQLAEEYAGEVYQTMMNTTVSPRNLGINHDINPGFYPPDPAEGRIVFNVDADSAGVGIQPDSAQQLMINRLSYWGYTLTIVTDNMILTQDYSDINLLVLRYMESGRHGGPTAVFLDT